MAHITYLVLYVSDLERSRSFYEGLGLTFVPEKHGGGPDHYSCTLEAGTVLELYPQRGSAIPGLRLGLCIPGAEARLIRDPDGNCVEVSNG